MTMKRSARMAVLACASVASLGLLVGASPAAAKTKTKTAVFNHCASFAVPIPDFPATTTGTPVDSTAAVSIPVSVPKNGKKPQNGIVTGFNDVNVRITHTFDGDLALYLVSPGGQVALLAYRRGSGGDGYGTGSPSCSGSPVLFGDGFGTPINAPGNTGDNPISGSFKPEQPLSRFVGGPAKGNWTLVVTDEDNVDSGTINALSLNFTYQYKVPVKKKK
jgi:subtilisin-like proprotein convertase family protein